jgi:hypothetical protein
MNVAAVPLKQVVIKVLDELPPEQVVELLDFALFLKQRSQMPYRPFPKPVAIAVPAAHLDGLVGLVAWGGDALADTERLYEA